MTRINVGVPPKDLSRQHLIAEHREIKRIPNVISRGKYKMVGIPKEFTLGTGHVKFFYDKLLYLRNRYEELYQECLNRGYKMTYYGGCWDNVPSELLNDYTPTERDIELIKQRIKEKSEM
jgi:hypothetical protein